MLFFPYQSLLDYLGARVHGPELYFQDKSCLAREFLYPCTARAERAT